MLLCILPLQVRVHQAVRLDNPQQFKDWKAAYESKCLSAAYVCLQRAGCLVSKQIHAFLPL